MSLMHLQKMQRMDDEDTDPLWISPLQVRFRKLKFSESGYLTKPSQRKMAKAMNGIKSNTPSRSKAKNRATSPTKRDKKRPSRHSTRRTKANQVVSQSNYQFPENAHLPRRKPNTRYNLRGTAPRPITTVSTRVTSPKRIKARPSPSRVRRPNGRYNLRGTTPSNRSTGSISEAQKRKIGAWGPVASTGIQLRRSRRVQAKKEASDPSRI